ncbi:MAG: class I SAM-dependent methyltransferase [Candidatus Cloacimonetes bacterium]|nr:class I SAM-dependent methyltransferase [Candidatus Cloacimonadota bacterium]
MKSECKFCGAINFSKYLEDRGYKYFRCKKCSLVQLVPMPTDEELKDAYSQKYYNEEKNFVKKFYWNLHESYEKLLTIERRIGKIKNLKLFDVGAGEGRFLDVAREFEAVTYGSEISDYGKQEIIKKGHNFVDNISEYKNFFDIITLWDVAEHLNEPLNEYHTYFDALKTNGHIFIATSWIDDLIDNIIFGYTMWSDPPYHTLLYNKSTLQKFLNNAGFKSILREKTHQSGNYYHYTKSFWLTKQIVKKYLRYGEWKRAKRNIQAGVGSYLFVSAQKS